MIILFTNEHSDKPNWEDEKLTNIFIFIKMSCKKPWKQNPKPHSELYTQKKLVLGIGFGISTQPIPKYS
jgi:hypothetical protein